jgi:hypothetical protein
MKPIEQKELKLFSPRKLEISNLRKLTWLIRPNRNRSLIRKSLILKRKSKGLKI